MTINCIETRLHIIERIWQKHHDVKHCKIMLQQLGNDIIFMCNEKLPDNLDERLDKLINEVNENDYKQCRFLQLCT